MESQSRRDIFVGDKIEMLSRRAAEESRSTQINQKRDPKDLKRAQKGFRSN